MTMQLMQFDFEMATVRTVCDDGQPWFVGADIVHALGYAEMNPNLFNHVPDEWKGVKRIQGNRGEREAICLSEQGLYFFVVRSDKPKALPFQKWLAGVVLPAIRKTGYYRQGKPADPMGLYAKKVQIMEKLTRTSHPTIRQELRDWLGWTYQQLGHAVPDANNLHPRAKEGNRAMNAQDYRKEVAPLFGELDLIHQYAATTSRLAEHHPDAVSEQDWFLLWTVLSVLVNDLAAEVR